MKYLKSGGIIILIFIIICGIIYPIFVTGISQILFKNKVNGSIIEVNGKKYGSELIGQQFTEDKYLWGRVMIIDTGTFKDKYGNDLMYAFPSNLSPGSDEYEKSIKDRINKIKESNGNKDNESIPVDLVTVSGSGIDPHISVKAANYQVARIAKERNMSESDVIEIIDKYTTGRFLGIFGEERVNVLMVNLALEGIVK